MRPPSDSKTLLLRSSRWGGAGAGGTPAGRASCSPPFSWAVRREHYSSPRLTTTVRSGAIRPLSTAGFPLPEESGGWDPSPRCRCYQACQSDSRRRLFTQVRGRGILGSPDAGSCIDRPRELRGWLLRASTLRGRGLHVVVLDGYAGRRIGTGPEND